MPFHSGALVIAALVVAMGATTTVQASADTTATVEVDTQRMSGAGASARPDGVYNAGDELTLVCSTRGPGAAGLVTAMAAGRGNDLWYQTSDGHYVSDADIETGTLRVAAPDCAAAATGGAPAASAPVADASRTVGRTVSANPGAPGQCTWGAAQKWYDASGSYPAMAGNALSWGDSAAAAGWTVVPDARERSIVVFQPGVAGAGPIGHVAWVDSVSQRLDGTIIHITEMNNTFYGGPGIFNQRDVRQVPGMSYVLLP